MSGLVPTREQAAAIGHPQEDACVVAGAGSGKTAVLTRRFLHLAGPGGLPLRSIVALTFTEKAALEMRERIALGLEAQGRAEEREDLEFASVSTFHAYCARLLRLHAVDAGVDPAFQVLDAADALLLAEDAARLAERALEAEGTEDLLVLARLAAGSGAWLALLDRVRGAGLAPRDLTWVAGDHDEGALLAEAHAAAAGLAEVLGGLEHDLAARLAGTLAEVGNTLGAEDRDPWRLAALAEEVAGQRPRTGNGPRVFTAARKRLHEALTAVADQRLDGFAARRIRPALVRVLEAIDDAYTRLKRERGVLDFSDLELRAHGLLVRLEEQGRPLTHPPAALLVDEYQDTNPLQARILERLRRGSCFQFAVGDPKQSIYRFRRADVRVLAAEQARVGARGRHVLDATFRARPELVDCLNALHERLLADGRAGAPHVPMRAAAAFRQVPGPDVELLLVDVGSGAGAAVAREAEARTIAAWIEDLVGRRLPRAKIERDAQGRELPGRPLEHGDIAILFRARTNLGTYEDALAARGIPFHTHKGRGYFQAEEITDLIHVLRVVHDPADDHALAAVLTGPAFGATDEDLLGTFDAERRQPGAAWARVLEDAARGHPRAARARRLEELAREATQGSLGRVVEGALFDLGLVEAALLQPDGARRAANLRKALAVAHRLESTGRANLADLLRHLSMLRDREVPESEAALAREGEGVVRLLTVHGAKGLEYPVVIVADIGRRPPTQRADILFDGEGGFAARLADPVEGAGRKPGGYRRLEDEEARLEEEESRRLLYVATTRAEERLVLTGSFQGLTKKEGRPAYLQGWGPMLLEAFDATVPGAAHTVRLGAGQARLEVVDPPPALSPPPPPAPEVAVPAAAAVVARAARILEGADRPLAPLGGTPYVVTVSELMAFARSPARAYADRLVPETGEAVQRPAPEPDDPAAGSELAHEELGGGAARRQRWDEPSVTSPSRGIDRSALGRALHGVLERWDGDPATTRRAIERAMEEEPLGERHPEVQALLLEMASRFERSPTGRAAREMLGNAGDLRRELSFHARILFPGRVRVGPFPSLLVRGSIDLWMRRPEGLWLVDHKTNPPGGMLATPEDVRAHYTWQLRLYALAAERLTGEDVAGARLLLLDPGWGPEPLELDVDVSGEGLEDGRRLCEAYARAELEGRWPEDWRALLAPGG